MAKEETQTGEEDKIRRGGTNTYIAHMIHMRGYSLSFSLSLSLSLHIIAIKFASAEKSDRIPIKIRLFECMRNESMVVSLKPVNF